MLGDANGALYGADRLGDDVDARRDVEEAENDLPDEAAPALGPEGMDDGGPRMAQTACISSACTAVAPPGPLIMLYTTQRAFVHFISTKSDSRYLASLLARRGLPVELLNIL